MSFRIAAVAFVVGLLATGFANAHTRINQGGADVVLPQGASKDDPVTCPGWVDYSGAYASHTASGSTFYLVARTSPGDYTPPGAFTDADRAAPLSIWQESNGRARMQTIGRCVYSDGHSYVGDNPLYTGPPDRLLAPPAP